MVWVCTWTNGHLEAVARAAARAAGLLREAARTDATGSANGRGGPRASRTRSAWCCGTRRFSRRGRTVAVGARRPPIATSLRDDQYFPIQGMYGSTWREDDAAGRRHADRTLDPRRRHHPLVARRSRHGCCPHRDGSGTPGIDDIVAGHDGLRRWLCRPLTSVWHQVDPRSSRRLEVFCEDALFWTEDDYLGHSTWRPPVAPTPSSALRPSGPPASRCPSSTPRQWPPTPRPACSSWAHSRPTARAIGHPSAATALAAHRIVDASMRRRRAGGGPRAARDRRGMSRRSLTSARIP